MATAGSLVEFIHRVLYTIRASCLGWTVPEKVTFETDLPDFTNTWRVQHPTPAMLFKEISTSLDFMNAHPTFFSEEPWPWAMRFMAATHQDIEQTTVCVLELDTGSVIF